MRINGSYWRRSVWLYGGTRANSFRTLHDRLAELAIKKGFAHPANDTSARMMLWLNNLDKNPPSYVLWASETDVPEFEVWTKAFLTIPSGRESTILHISSGSWNTPFNYVPFLYISTMEITFIPEPSGMAMLGLGLAFFGFRRKGKTLGPKLNKLRGL